MMSCLTEVGSRVSLKMTHWGGLATTLGLYSSCSRSIALRMFLIVRQSVEVGPVTSGLRPGLVKRMWPLPSVSTDQPRSAASLARSRISLLARLVRPGFFS